MDDIPLPFPTKENHTNSPASIPPIEHMITPSRRQPIPPLNNDIGSTTKSTAGASVAPKAETALRNRWHVCPELHKAMDGITYIADQKKKEEESTKVSRSFRYFLFNFECYFWRILSFVLYSSDNKDKDMIETIIELFKGFSLFICTSHTLYIYHRTSLLTMLFVYCCFKLYVCTFVRSDLFPHIHGYTEDIFLCVREVFLFEFHIPHEPFRQSL